MRRIVWFAAVLALLLVCAGLAAAQCAGNQNPGGFDLLSTFNGTTDNSPGGGLPAVNFVGVPLPNGVAGSADTIVCRLDPLPNPVPTLGAKLRIQIVALLLQSDPNQTVLFQGQPVTVFATINQTKDASDPNFVISLNQLPQPDTLSASSGTMTVFPNNTFDTNTLTIQADIIIVPQGGKVTDTPIKHFPMNSDTISSKGSTWTTTAPAGYPNSSSFPAGGFYVNQPGALGTVLPVVTSPMVRVSLYSLAVFLLGIAMLKIRSGINNGRLTLRPIYLLGLAVLAWFVAWRAGKIAFPTIAHAAAFTTCVPHTVSAWVNEGNGQFVVHKIVTAVCTTIQSQTASFSSL